MAAFNLVVRNATGRAKVPVDCAQESEAEQSAAALALLLRIEEEAEDGYPAFPTSIYFPEKADAGGVRLSVLARHFTGARLKFENKRAEVRAAGDAAGADAGSGGKKKKKQKKPALRGGSDLHYVEVDMRTLFLSLGLWRALANDVAEYNLTVEAERAGELTDGTARRYGRHRLLKQLRELGATRPAAGRLLAVPGLAALIAVIEAVHGDELAEARAAIAQGRCTFDGFAELYAPGREVIDRRGAITGLFGVTTSFCVRSCFYREGKSMMQKMERTCHVALEFVVSTGRRFAVIEVVQVFVPFRGKRRFAELDLAPLGEGGASSALRGRLETRGAVYQRVAVRQHFVGYTASTFLAMRAPLGGGSGRKKPVVLSGGKQRGAAVSRPGRMMVDTAASHAVGHNAARFTGVACDAVLGAMRYEMAVERRREAARGANDAASQAAAAGEDDDDGPLMLDADAPLPARLLRRCWPAVAGFSFTSKSWGGAFVRTRAHSARARSQRC